MNENNKEKNEMVSSSTEESDPLVEQVGKWLANLGIDRESEAEVEKALGLLLSAMTPVTQEIPEELLGLISRGAIFERELQRREAEAELRGKNIGIEQMMNLATGTDGLPHPSTSDSKRKCSDSNDIFAMARGAR